jgi:C-terminal processing protease CtpA/Prc
VVTVEPKGAAERAGVRVGDVFESVGEKSVQDVGNGIVRNYLALLLTSQKSVPVVTSRGGALVPMRFRLE